MDPVLPNYDAIAAQLRQIHADGVARVPQSAYNAVSTIEVMQYYGRMVNEIKLLLRNVSISQSVAESALKNVTSSFIDAARALEDDAVSHIEVANSLAIAATLLKDAADAPSNSTNIMAMFTNASALFTNAATSITAHATKSHPDITKLLGDASESLNVAVTALAEENHAIVFMYDINEISMLSRNYIGEFLTKFPEIQSIFPRVLVDFIVKDCGFNNMGDVREGDVVNIADAVIDGTALMRRHVPNYNNLKQFYSDISNRTPNLGPIINQELIHRCNMGDRIREICQAAEQLQLKANHRWRNVKRCLNLVNQRSAESDRKYANVAITDLGLAFGAAQLLVSGHAPMIPIENIYSTLLSSKEEVIERIRRRFGEKCILVYIMSPETSTIPQTPQVFIWRVEAGDSITHLHTAQRDHLLR